MEKNNITSLNWVELNKKGNCQFKQYKEPEISKGRLVRLAFVALYDGRTRCEPNFLLNKSEHKSSLKRASLFSEDMLLLFKRLVEGVKI